MTRASPLLLSLLLLALSFSAHATSPAHLPPAAVRMPKAIFLSKFCTGRGVARKICRRKARFGVCKVIKCKRANGKPGFKCRCRRAPKPVKPSMRPPKPSKKPAKPSKKPVKPSMKPAKPSKKPAKPSMKPTKPSKKPAKPSMKPAKPSKKPAKPSPLPSKKPPTASLLPIPSIKPGPVGPNKPCVKGVNKCPKGYTCSCGGKCRRKVMLKISAVADDFVTLYMCGKKIGGTPSFDEVSEIMYKGTCDNIIVGATNLKRNTTQFNPLAVSVLVQSGKTTYGTSSSKKKVIPLDTVGTFMPAKGYEFNRRRFDYTTWVPVGIVDFLKETFPGFQMLFALGAEPVSTTADSAPPGLYGFRIDDPYC